MIDTAVTHSAPAVTDTTPVIALSHKLAARLLPGHTPEAAYNTIAALCASWEVAEFALFGSILRDDFHPDSDIDVLYRLRDGVRPTLSLIMEMGDDLEALFGRKVDLVDRIAVERSRNYLRRQQILASAQVIYAE